MRLILSFLLVTISLLTSDIVHSCACCSQDQTSVTGNLKNMRKNEKEIFGKLKFRGDINFTKVIYESSEEFGPYKIEGYSIDDLIQFDIYDHGKTIGTIKFDKSDSVESHVADIRPLWSKDRYEKLLGDKDGNTVICEVIKIKRSVNCSGELFQKIPSVKKANLVISANGSDDWEKVDFHHWQMNLTDGQGMNDEFHFEISGDVYK